MNHNNNSNRAFEEMMRAARERLEGRDPIDIAQKSGILYDGVSKEFRLKSLDTELRVSYPAYEITPKINEWTQMVLLHYMDLANGLPLLGKLKTFVEVKEGLIRGGGFDRQCENLIRRYLADRPLEEVQKICESMGAQIVKSNADLCAVFPYLPYYPVTMKIWFSDEEIKGSGRMFLDWSADDYLKIEDAVTVGQCIIGEILRRSGQRMDVAD